MTVLNLLDGVLRSRSLPTALAGLLVIALIQYVHSTPEAQLRLRWRKYLTLGAQAALNYILLVMYGPWWGMTGFVAGSCLLLLPPRPAWTLYGAVVVSMFAFAVTSGETWTNSVYKAISTQISGTMVYGLSHLSQVIQRLRDTQHDLARTAVSEERLRFARELHDFLGNSLSSIALKTELVRRLVANEPDRATREVDAVLALSRQSLTDVRAVASGYRDIPLAQELGSARSILGAAGITLRTEFSPGEVSRAVDTALSAILREAVTNVLRHSQADRCTITVSRSDRGQVRLTVVNNGARPSHRSTAPDHSNGLSVLAVRLESIGGRLISRHTGDGEFLLMAEAPAQQDGPATPTGNVEAGQRPSIGEARRLAVLMRSRIGRRSTAVHQSGLHTPAPRTARGILVTTWLLYSFLILCNVLNLKLRTDILALSLAGLAATSALQYVHFTPRFQRRLGRGIYATLAVQGLLSYLPIVVWGQWWGSMAGSFCGSVLLLLSPRLAWPLYFVAGTGLSLSASLVGDRTWEWSFYFSQSSMLCGLVIYGHAHFSHVIERLDRTRTELARSAITQERLRFARDLHDLLGSSLSSITLKTELVRRLIPAHPDRALQEVDDVLAIARRSLADVRTVAAGHRHMCLDEEITSARSVLTAAQVDVRTGTVPQGMSPRTGTVLATVLREAVTNVLRHSEATCCTIAVTGGPVHDRVRLAVTNDGAGSTPHPHGTGTGTGTGLGNLAARLESIGGTLTFARTDNGQFRLEAEAPARHTGEPTVRAEEFTILRGKTPESA
ncbi:sensor histidine kinase [Streptomyces gamaensis]|uniref:Sensor histidine kinase n=1 Tax=Streptomyces gamaensis TaxID=1763542 RepID=A0ABW0YYW8_9ACTN